MPEPKVLPITITAENYSQIVNYCLDNMTARVSQPILQFLHDAQATAQRDAQRPKAPSPAPNATSSVSPKRKR